MRREFDVRWFVGAHTEDGIVMASLSYAERGMNVYNYASTVYQELRTRRATRLLIL